MALGKSFIIIVLALFVLSCAQGHCRRIEKEQEKQTAIQASVEKSKDGENTRKMEIYKKRVLVFKYDQTLQCESWKGISLDKMERELAPIEVLSKDKKHDGLARIQVCGSPTGYANVYEIYEQDLEQALAKGFKLWKLH